MRRIGRSLGRRRGLWAVAVLVIAGTVLAVARRNVEEKLRGRDSDPDGSRSGAQADPQSDSGSGWSALDGSRRGSRRHGNAGLSRAQRLLLSNCNAAPDSEIDSDSVRALRVAWEFRADGPVSHDPLVAGNRLYTADWGGSVYCLDVTTGRELWTSRLGRPESDWPWHGFAGTGALGDELLLEASAEGTIYALDPDNGDVVWERTFTSNPNAGNAGRLLCHGGMVFVPVQSVEEALAETVPGFQPSFRGHVVALDERTGETVWDLPLVDQDHDGVAVWTGFALDPEEGTLFFATGNNYTGEATELSDSLVAVDARTGKVRWHRQVTDNDVWTMAQPIGPDADFTGAPQLFEVVVDGENRRLVGAGQKSGVYTVWDRDTGRRVWNATIGFGEVGGGIHSEPSVTVDRLLIWSNNSFAFKDPEGHPMNVAALHPANGGYVWMNREIQPAAVRTSGFLAGDLYFVPSLDGRVRAYRADDGEPVWTSGSHDSIASSVKVAGGMLFFGTGVPESFGGDGGAGSVVAYRLVQEGLVQRAGWGE